MANKLKVTIKRAKANGVTKDDFKATVFGMSKDQMRTRGKTNAKIHTKQKEMETLIDTLWDEPNLDKKGSS